MGGTTAKTSLIKDGEVSVAQGYHIGGYASGHPVMLPVVDIVEVGAGGGSIALDRRSRRAEASARRARAPTRARSAIGAAARSRPSPTRTSCSAASAPTSFLGGEMPLDVGGRARAVSKRRSARRSGMNADRGRARHRQDCGGRRCRSPCAACRSSAATIRATSRWSRSAAPGPLHAARDRARRCRFPTRDRAEPAGALLGARHADGRRAPRLRAHVLPSALVEADYARARAHLRRAPARRSRHARQRGRRAAARGFQYWLDLRYVGQEFWLQMPVTEAEIAERRQRGDPAAFRRDPRSSVRPRRARRAARAREPAPDGDRRAAEDRVPEAAGGRGGARVGTREIHLDDAARPTACAVYRREKLTPGGRMRARPSSRNTRRPRCCSRGRAARRRHGEILVNVAAGVIGRGAQFSASGETPDHGARAQWSRATAGARRRRH